MAVMARFMSSVSASNDGKFDPFYCIKWTVLKFVYIKIMLELNKPLIYTF